MKTASEMPRLVILLNLLALTKGLRQFESENNDDREVFAKNRYRRTLEWITESWQKAVDQENQLMRLSNDLVPKNYDVRLLPVLENDNFTNFGSVDITVECAKDTQEIILTAGNYRIYSYEVIEFRTGISLEVKGSTHYGQWSNKEFFKIEMLKPLQMGKTYLILLSFVYKLNEVPQGLFYLSYNEDGIAKYLAASQLKATDARKMFPCFDVPSLKSTFKLSLGRKDTMSTVSNMPIAKTEPIQGMPGYVWDQYTTSEKLSTFALAAVIGELESVPTDVQLSELDFSVWARRNVTEQARYANYLGPELLNFLEGYFSIEYPLSKLDVVALPNYSEGANGNWGLLTARESEVLFYERVSSEKARQTVAQILADSIAQQWFGHFVTLEWWNDLWLTEGFATYMRHVALDSIDPSFRLNDQFTSVIMHPAMVIDALLSSRPLNMQGQNWREISSMFDILARNKGACIFRMCVQFIGTDTFQRGVARYIDSKAFGNARQDEFWRIIHQEALSDGVMLPVSLKHIMDTWANKMGYPLINVTRTYGSDGEAIITQSRFFWRQNSDLLNRASNRWWVPLTFTSNFSKPPTSFWMSDSEENKQINNVGADNEWVIFNVRQVGYYRVIYDEVNYELITRQLTTNHEIIDPINRAQLLDDGFNLARAGLLPYEKILDLTKYLERERDYLPWEAALRGFEFIDHSLQGKDGYTEWRNYLHHLIKILYTSLGFLESPDDNRFRIYSRSMAIYWACNKLRDSECIRHARALYTEWMERPTIANKYLSRNVREAIMCAVLAEGSDAEWSYAYNEYDNSLVANEKMEIELAMACTQNNEKLESLLRKSLERNSVGGFSFIFEHIASHPTGHSVAFDFLETHWNEIDNRVNGGQDNRKHRSFGGEPLTDLFFTIAKQVNTQSQLERLVRLRKEHITDGLANSKKVEQGIELAKENVVWQRNYRNSIHRWLLNHHISSSSSSRTISKLGWATFTIAFVLFFL